MIKRGKLSLCDRVPHSTVILRKYFKNIPLQFFNIARIFIKRQKDFKNISKSFQKYHYKNIYPHSQKYFQSFIAMEILSQYFCQILQNISLQHYNFNFLKYFCKQINIYCFQKYCRQFHRNLPILHFSRIFQNIASEDDIFFF